MKHLRVAILAGLAIALVIGAAFVVYRNSGHLIHPKTVRFIVWHTENDETAQADLDPRLKDELTRQVDDEWRAAGENKRLDVETQYVPWGQLAMKLSAVEGSDSEPNLTHLEPYMTAAFFHAGRLYPLDGIVNAVTQDNEQGSTREIMPSVATLQKYGDHTYGIAYAVGVTFYSYRKDWVRGQAGADLSSAPPRTWQQLIAMMPRLQAIARQHNAENVVLLPGGDPFFLDQFFGETLASFGGSLFRQEGSQFVPNFESHEVNQTLLALHQLSPYLVKNWSTVSYLDQYQLFGRGKALLLPVTYARATAAIKRNYTGGEANDTIFGVFKQPGVTEGMGKATIDCEDWVILRRQGASDAEETEMTEIARKYLLLYYQRDLYLQFTSRVPVHLTPVFTDLNKWPDGPYWQQDNVARWLGSWKSWAIQSQEMLSKPGSVNPILMSSPQDNQNPLLYECQKARIITDMLQVALRPDSTQQDIEEAQHEAQRRALALAKAFPGK